MNITLIKKLDAVFGFISASVLPAPVHRELFSPITSVLIIRPGGIGDAILLAPAIFYLKKIFPSLHITVMAEQRNAGIFPLVPGVDTILCYDRPREFIQALCGQYDLVIDTEQWYRLSAVVARFVRAPVKIGFDTNERRRMFTHPVSYSHEDYEAESFMRLLAPLGINEGLVDRRAPYLALPVSASEKAAHLLKPLDDKPFVVIFPGASIPEKRWSTDRFIEVARRLVENGYMIVVVGGREDRSVSEEIAGAGDLNLAGLTTLAETAAVISRSRLVISGDSGVLHLSAGLEVPTVSLYGPSSNTKWAPKGEKHVVLNLQLACSPCSRFGMTPACPHGARCMNEITADQVVEAAVRLLKKM